MLNKNFEFVGKWWNDKNIELIKKNDKVYALNNWNGEVYLNCWECTGDHNLDASKEEYIIRPVWIEIAEEKFEIIDFEIFEV